jgi:hypothetical protein
VKGSIARRTPSHIPLTASEVFAGRRLREVSKSIEENIG